MILLSLWLGCTEPVPLPAPKATAPAARGRMLQHDQVRGYISRPTDTTPTSAVLLLVETIDTHSQNEADTRARGGVTVLAIDAQTHTQAAEQYLLQLPHIASVAQTCQRAQCP